MTSISTLDLLVSRWSGLLVAIATLVGLIVFATRDQARSATHSIPPKPRALIIGAIVCAAVAVLGRLYPLLK